jgi:ribosomal protein S18 acetylase RimI-like enzyme
VAAVLELWEKSRSVAASLPDEPEALEPLIAGGSLLVAKSGGRVIGAVIAGWDGWRGNIYRLAVAEEERRRGVGLLLVRAAEESLRERGARRVTALVAREDLPAARLWEAAGYERDAYVDRFVRNL